MERHGSLIPKTRRRSTQRGFTLVELTWSVFILTILMAAVAMGLTSTLNLSRNNANRVVAANIASQKIDEVRQQAAKRFTDLTIAYSETTSTVDGVQYKVATDADWIPKDADTNPCDSTSDNPVAFVRYTVSVTWANMKTTAPVTAATIVTPPVKTFASGKGNVGVKVVGADNSPQENLTVTLAGPGGVPTYTKKTSSAGCAFFAQVDPLPSDQYTVTMNETGFVDIDGNQLVSKPATVLAGETADPLGFKYDRAASLDLTLEGAPAGGDPILLPTTSLPITLRNDQLSTQKRIFPAPATNAATRTLTNLFPFPDDPYTAWPGTCADSDPQGEKPDGSRYWPSGERTPGVKLTPGGTASLTFPMQSIEFSVYKDSINSSNLRADMLIKAEHITTVGECPSTWTMELGRTDTNGKLRVAVPYGTFRFYVEGETMLSPLVPIAASPPADSVAPLNLVYD